MTRETLAFSLLAILVLGALGALLIARFRARREHRRIWGDQKRK